MITNIRKTIALAFGIVSIYGGEIIADERGNVQVNDCYVSSILKSGEVSVSEGVVDKFNTRGGIVVSEKGDVKVAFTNLNAKLTSPAWVSLESAHVDKVQASQGARLTRGSGCKEVKAELIDIRDYSEVEIAYAKKGLSVIDGSKVGKAFITNYETGDPASGVLVRGKGSFIGEVEFTGRRGAVNVERPSEKEAKEIALRINVINGDRFANGKLLDATV